MNVYSLKTRRDSEMARIKFGLITSGIRLARGAETVPADRKAPLRARSGVSGGIDLVLPGDVHCNCATNESFVSTSSFTLETEGSSYWVAEAGRKLAPVNIFPRPAYYDLRTTDGTPMIQVGQMCSADRICIGMTRNCFFWKKEHRCAFCSIGANAAVEARSKTAAMIAETVFAAAEDPILPARHVLIGGGTPNNADRGAIFAGSACRAIKEKKDISIYVMIAPPNDLDDIDRLHEAGADELGLNLEFYGEQALRKFTPGKYSEIGPKAYFRALERAVKIFGPVNTRAILIAGLEESATTLAGVERLAAMGVMPILSPFRPLDGSSLASSRGLSITEYIDLYERAENVCDRYSMYLGPTCIACQNNTLSLPNRPEYHYY